MSSNGMSRDSRSPTAVPTILPITPVAETGATLSAPSEPASFAMPPARESLVNMKLTIEALLDPAVRKEFNHAVNGLTRLGNRKPKSVEPRRQKIRDIVSENEEIVDLYKVYATTQRAIERRLTFQLPLLAELGARGEGNMPQTMNRKRWMTPIDEDNDAIIARLKPVPGSLEAIREQVDRETKARVGKAIESTQKQKEDESRTAQGPKAPISEEHDSREPMGLQIDRHIESSALGTSPIVEPDQGSQQKDSGKSLDKETSLCPDDSNESKVVGSMQDDSEMTGVSSLEGGSRDDAAAGLLQLPCDTKTNAVGADKEESGEVEKQTAPLSWSGPPTTDHIYLTPVTNPEMFPMGRIQFVQSQYYPSARIVSMWTHRDSNGGIGEISADMQDGPVNHLLIKEARIVAALGLLDGANDTISFRDDAFRIHETFSISVLPNQCMKNLYTFLVGELKTARHAFLYWLDSRGSSDPKCPPYGQEIRHIAVQLGRRAPDVWKEIDGYWQLEQGSGGSMYRRDRTKYLGEDPVYNEDTKVKKPEVLSMWG
jgi:hypothetical protein